MFKVKLLRPSKKMTIVAQPRSLPRASGYCFSKTYIVCTADKDWNEKIKTSINKLIDVTVAFDAIAGEQMSGTLLCDALSLLLSPKETCLLCTGRQKMLEMCTSWISFITKALARIPSYAMDRIWLVEATLVPMIIRRFRRKKATTRDINAGLLVERGWAGPTRPCLSIAFCKICFTKFVEEMWNQDGVTGKKLGIQMNQKEEGRGLDFLRSHHCQRANTMNNLLTYILY
jgi:hypothetical protein